MSIPTSLLLLCISMSLAVGGLILVQPLVALGLIRDFRRAPSAHVMSKCNGLANVPTSCGSALRSPPRWARGRI
jgi:hypothetical protein